MKSWVGQPTAHSLPMKWSPVQLLGERRRRCFWHATLGRTNQTMTLVRLCVAISAQAYKNWPKLNKINKKYLWETDLGPDQQCSPWQCVRACYSCSSVHVPRDSRGRNVPLNYTWNNVLQTEHTAALTNKLIINNLQSHRRHSTLLHCWQLILS